MARFAAIFSIISSCAALSYKACTGHNKDHLYQEAANISARADELLVPSQFARVVDGHLVLIRDEEDGKEDGGSSNTEGSYFSFFFNSTEIFPEGICDIPPNPVNGGTGSICNNETSVSFLLGPADAIAFLTCTPPPVRYFSFDAYIDIRLTEEYPYYVGQPFGDTVSHFTINTTGTAEDPNNVFNEPVLVIHSADGAAARAVAESFVSTGDVAESAVSVRQIDSETVRLWDRSNGQTWHESQPDILTMVGRVTMPARGSTLDYRKYQEEVWPVKFYFAHDDAVAKEPLVPPLLSRDADAVVNETSVFSTSYNSLYEKVIEEYVNNRGAKYLITESDNYTMLGFYDDWDAILDLKSNSSFVLDTRDALYGSPDTTAIKPVPKNCGAVAIGIIHQMTMGAAYNSVGISTMDMPTGNYIESHWFVDDDLKGSATRYLPDDPNAEYMFAVDFMPPGMCSPDAKWCIEFSQASYDNPNAGFIFGERVYCLNETMIGPPANKTLPAMLPIFVF